MRSKNEQHAIDGPRATEPAWETLTGTGVVNLSKSADDTLNISKRTRVCTLIIIQAT
jgi:hypothetical protein